MSVDRANAGPEVLEAIARRWSPRAFTDEPVAPGDLLACLEAARWAASSYNEQPWALVVGVRGRGDTHGRILNCLTERNQAWAGAAPVLMIAVARLTFTADGRPNRSAVHDVGLATANLMVQASALGLAAHAMAGFSGEKARETFGIGDGFEPTTAIALGHPGDAAALPADRRAAELAPRERKPLAEWVFSGRWGEASQVLDDA